jgi:ferredoxin
VTIEIIADRDLCIGSEMCAGVAPGTFTTDGEGKVVVIGDGGADGDDAVRLAIASCPVGALQVAS